MTSLTSWTSVIPMYVEALGKYTDETAQQPGGLPLLKKIHQGHPEKIAWVMMNHHSLHKLAAFLMMTRSIVAIIADTLWDITLAIYEVGEGLVLLHNCIDIFDLQDKLANTSQVEHVRPVRLFHKLA